MSPGIKHVRRSRHGGRSASRRGHLQRFTHCVSAYYFYFSVSSDERLRSDVPAPRVRQAWQLELAGRIHTDSSCPHLPFLVPSFSYASQSPQDLQTWPLNLTRKRSCEHPRSPCSPPSVIVADHEPKPLPRSCGASLQSGPILLISALIQRSPCKTSQIGSMRLSCSYKMRR